MLIEIPNLFSPQEAQAIRQQLEQSDWVDGKVTAGYQSGKVKNNRQLPKDHPLGREFGNRIIERLTASNVFMSAALPQKIFPRSEEHTSELQSLMRISYAVFCL